MKASRKDVERRTYRLKLSEVEMIHLHGLVRDHVPTSRLNSRIYSVLEAALTERAPAAQLAIAEAAVRTGPAREWRYGKGDPTWP